MSQPGGCYGEPPARRAIAAGQPRLTTERQRDRPGELRPAEERAEVHRFQRGAPEHIGSGAVEGTPEHLQQHAATLHRACAGEPEPSMVESCNRIDLFHSPRSIAELVQVKSG